jgi:hypothetical protein
MDRSLINFIDNTDGNHFLNPKIYELLAHWIDAVCEPQFLIHWYSTILNQIYKLYDQLDCLVTRSFFVENRSLLNVCYFSFEGFVVDGRDESVTSQEEIPLNVDSSSPPVWGLDLKVNSF